MYTKGVSKGKFRAGKNSSDLKERRPDHESIGLNILSKDLRDDWANPIPKFLLLRPWPMLGP